MSMKVSILFIFSQPCQLCRLLQLQWHIFTARVQFSNPKNLQVEATRLGDGDLHISFKSFHKE